MTELMTIPGYRIEREIGSGAMAKVYLAVHENLERQVALKVMSTELQGDRTFCDRFIKEARIMGRLAHPNIITVYDSGAYAHQYYLAMEYIPNGTTLKDRIRSGLPVQQALTFLKPIASALGFAHQQGFVHRDVKPANVLLRPDNTPLLADFGIAKSFGADATQMTQAGWTVGTPNYMSPEQALGGTLDARSDLYSLGVMFFEMLTGTKPYSSPIEHIQSPLPQLPGPLRTYQPLINKLMAKRPDDRFPSAEALIVAIDALLQPPSLLAAGDKEEATRITAKPDILRPAGADGGDTHLINSVLSAPSRPAGDRPVVDNTRFLNTAPRTAGARGGLWLGVTTVITLILGGLLATHPAVQPLWQSPLPISTTTPPRPADPVVPPREPPRDLVINSPVIGAPSGDPRVNRPASNPAGSSGDVQSRIRRLLIIANVHRDTGFFTDPPGSNALEAYEQVLALDPNNADAARGLDDIAAHFQTLAEQARDNGEPLPTVMGYVREGLRARPRHSALIALLTRLQGG